VSDDIRVRMVAVLPRLRRFAYALTGNTEQGDDLVQDACLRALSRIDLWQPGTRLDSWMYRIAQNIWLDRLRANKVRGEVVDIDAMEAAEIAGVPVGTVMSRLARARRTLNAVLNQPGRAQAARMSAKTGS
jgi:RNA polymerase sigma-70 factor (ECF subfamily)